MGKKAKNVSVTVFLLTAVIVAILLCLGVKAASGYVRYRKSREDSERIWSALCLISGQQAAEQKQNYFNPTGDSTENVQKRLSQNASEKGRTQRGKHLELLILVNPWNEMPEGYVPELVEATSNWQPVSDYLVDARCAEPLKRMINDCLLVGGIPEICSAYRTQDDQQFLFDRKITRLVEEGVDPEEAPALAATTIAVPGTSEHQLGLAVDILDVNYPYLDQWQEWTWTQQWLMEHCWEYGFILRYPNGTSDVTGIIYEPWHYRYVGMTHARRIHELDVTLEEYLALRNGR